MPINYELLELNCKNANIAGVRQELFVNGRGSALDRIQLNRIISLIVDLIDNSPDPLFVVEYKVILELLRNQRVPLLKNEDTTGRKKLFAYMDESSARRDEHTAQRRVCEKFWRIKKPLKDSSSSARLYQSISIELRKLPQNRLPILLDGYPSRSLIIALTKVIQENAGYPVLKFQIGETIIVCDPASAEEGLDGQRANHWVKVEQLPGERFTYGDWSTKDKKTQQVIKRGVYKFLSDFVVYQLDNTRIAREKQIAKCLREKAHTFSSFVLDDFNARGFIRIAGEDIFSLESYRTVDQKNSAKAQIDYRIHYLNGLNFLYSVCEVSRRLYRDFRGDIFNYTYHANPVNPKYSDNMPMGILQLRSLALVECGIITLNDLFGHSTHIYGKTVWKKNKDGEFYAFDGEGKHRAQYGVATGKSTIASIETTKGKEAVVNSTTELQITRGHHNLSFFYSPDAVVLTHAQSVKEGHNVLKDRLVEHFGNGNDSSEDDYSDNEEDVRQINFGFRNLNI